MKKYLFSLAVLAVGLGETTAYAADPTDNTKIQLTGNSYNILAKVPKDVFRDPSNMLVLRSNQFTHGTRYTIECSLKINSPTKSNASVYIGNLGAEFTGIAVDGNGKPIYGRGTSFFDIDPGNHKLTVTGYLRYPENTADGTLTIQNNDKVSDAVVTNCVATPNV